MQNLVSVVWHGADPCCRDTRAVRTAHHERIEDIGAFHKTRMRVCDECERTMGSCGKRVGEGGEVGRERMGETSPVDVELLTAA